MKKELSGSESTYSAADRRAQDHGAGPLAVEGYQQVVELCGRVADGWLFRYRIHCSLNIPAHEQESFAGAAGCLVADDGLVRDLSGPMFMDMLRTVA
ncbi:hypothetical protein LOY35_27485 [Pseudomonas sp. B21-028]|uniref:hypothetical protein n=1 Tax=Pseudomonas sp. B21-028 TaxID=2895480 RepID=UPI00215E7478|nr:hypothetical protein [Pseudomonas sp. B21-028]UVL83859.1 hypothetical protein LOY35_27485 [Pseudomonas sp. B21-028]